MAFGNYGFNQQPTPYQAQSYPSINPYMQQRTEYAQINQPGTILRDTLRAVKKL